MFQILVLILTVAGFTINRSLSVLNWTDAKRACREVGLELASVLNEKEKVLLEKFVVKFKLAPTDKWTGYWLSGIRYPNGTFFWDVTGALVGETVTNWQIGEPSNAYRRENCLELKLEDGELGWNDYFCDENRRYICQSTRKEGPHSQDLEDYSFLAQENKVGTQENFWVRKPYP